MHAPEEIELKAGLAAGDLANLARHLAATHGTPRVRRLHARYFDTADEALARAGMSLRIRDEDGVRVQALKSGGAILDGFHRIAEDEAVIASWCPALDRLRDPERRAFLEGLSLSPRFETRVRRSTWTIAVPGGRVEVALDKGVIRALDPLAGPDLRPAEPVAEVEFELLEGSPEAVFDGAMALLSDLPARLDLPSKAARGAALAAGAAWNPRPPGRPAPVPAGMAAGAAFEAQLRALARAVAVHLHAALTRDDPEGPHQLRVALRRLRVALRCFRSLIAPDLARALATRARDIGRLVSPMRDADVLTGALVALADAPLAAALERARAATRAAARTSLLGAGATGLAIRLLKHASLGGWQRRRAHGDFPAAAVTAPTLDRLWERVCDRGDRLASLGEEARHDFRKDLKKLRYSSEILVGGPGQKRFLSALRKLQDDLGALNDRAVLETFQPTLDDPAAEAAFATLKAQLLSSGRSRADQQLGRACRHWQALAATGPWWHQVPSFGPGRDRKEGPGAGGLRLPALEAPNR